jgi:hypothetical protein
MPSGMKRRDAAVARDEVGDGLAAGDRRERCGGGDDEEDDVRDAERAAVQPRRLLRGLDRWDAARRAD